jgi:hypothetical protein
MAANNIMIVLALNDCPCFLIQFAPYTDNTTQSNQQSCYIEYYDDSEFVYTVALGKNQSTYNFFFVGEMLGLAEDDQSANRTFVGVLNYTGSLTTIDCDDFTYTIRFVPTGFAHQEHLVMVTDPFGLVAYGFSDLFTFSYTAATSALLPYLNSSLSPLTSFLPLAVDYDGSRGVIAGFLRNNDSNSRM